MNQDHRHIPGLSEKLLNSLPYAIVVLDSARDIVYANEHTSQLLKAPVSEIVGKSSDHFKVKVNPGVSFDRFNEVHRTGNHKLLFMDLQTIDGGSIETEITLIPITSKEKQYSLVIIKDVIAKNMSENRLKRSERNLSVFIQNAPVSIAMFDKNMNFMACSKKYLEDWWVGYDKIDIDDIVDKNHYEIFKDVTDGWKRIHYRALEGETLVNEKEKFIKSDGKEEWLRWHIQPWYSSGKKIGGVILFTEFITARHRAEETLRKIQANLNVAQRVSQVGSWDWDIETNELFWSEQYYRLLGEEPGSFKPDLQKAQSYIHQDDKEKVLNALDDVVQTGNPYSLENRIITKTGEVKYTNIRGERIIDEQTGKVKVIGALQDITAKKEAEKELIKLTKDLSKSNEELRQFAYMISHDLRAPVVNLDALLKFYNDENTTVTDKAVIMEKVIKSANQLKTTLNDLINLVSAKNDKADKDEKLGFKETVVKIMQRLETQIHEANATISTDFSQAPEVITKKTVLESIVQNLLSNALKYRGDNDAVIKISTEKSDSYITFTITDYGAGIDLETYGDKVFGMYQRFHENMDGKGLGLYLIKSQIESLDGKITVDSKPGAGTTFKVYFKRFG